MLNVSPNTLRAWERRFGFPKPQRSPGKHRLYTHGEIAALRDALHEGLSISSAISRAREGLSADGNTLVGALGSFERERADDAMEAVLALRSLERGVEDILLPALAEVHRRHGADSAQWAFAARWGNEWLRRAQRLAPPPARGLNLLIGDATGGELDPDAMELRAFELHCMRAGARCLGLAIEGVSGLADAVRQLEPNAVVIAGAHARDDEVARWAYAVRAISGPQPVALFRRDVERPVRLRTTGTHTLAPTPYIAQEELLDLLDAREHVPHRPVIAGAIGGVR